MSQPSPLQATRRHAQALADAGEPAQARALLEHAVELGRMNLGEDDPEVLTTAHQLAVVLHRAGDAPGARRVLEEAYAAGQWRLGETDPLMLGISYELGVVAEEMENRHEARRAFGRVAAHGPGVLGPDHWMVTRARDYLGEDPPTVRMELPAPVVTPAAAPAPAPAPAPFSGAPVSFPGASFAGAPAVPPFPEVPPAPGAWAAAPAVPRETVVAAPAQPARSGFSMRAPALFAAIAAAFGVIIAVVALVVVLAKPGDKDDRSNAPTLSGPAPTDVRMRDYGSSVKLFWTDPANGRVSFIVTGGHPGEQLKSMGQVGPGTTSFDLNGLNPDLDYCFAIVAVYSATQFATSPQTCTSRDAATPKKS
ncbi:fibronectin type III domain-containing protein [Actinoplanes sp. N902-109]|uniref:fibronectin type III domain-containing protein n=1 Tax=Actinoplanes sp. (strain N902-109) TaxID=649831 RepID=UPI00032945EE|nr:tetratricopeptide repeat protein [Actinoplanes sp. N902-109]AGL15923.1 fibronectin type III domain-containing protein [Actinoplanes sp. N902-109]